MSPIAEVKCEKKVTKVYVKVRAQQKRKLPDKKHKCDICGRMLLNEAGLNIHKVKMHAVESKILKQSKGLSRSDSVKSANSVKSPPPKKIQNDVKPEETPLPEDTEGIEIDSDEKTDIEKELRFVKEETVDLKEKLEVLRNINNNYNENHRNIVEKMKNEHKKELEKVTEEYKKIPDNDYQTSE